MTGKYDVVIYDSSIRYEFTLERKITIIKGNSGTGKTTLYDMVRDLEENEHSGVSCNRKGQVLVIGSSKRYKELLKSVHNKIIFIDENFQYLGIEEFSSDVGKSDNYFVIITRKLFINKLTYSIDSIFELSSSRNGDMYTTRFMRKYENTDIIVSPDVVICEDKKSGYSMMRNIFKSSCAVESAGGKDKVPGKVLEYSDKVVYAIVDGAGFGNTMSVFSNVMFYNSNVYLFAPESFEYMLLKSDKFKKYVGDMLNRTYNYCDCSKFLTWEQFYTNLLEKICDEKFWVRYTKSDLPDFFRTEEFRSHIASFLVDIDKDSLISDFNTPWIEGKEHHKSGWIKNRQ